MGQQACSCNNKLSRGVFINKLANTSRALERNFNGNVSRNVYHALYVIWISKGKRIRVCIQLLNNGTSARKKSLSLFVSVISLKFEQRIKKTSGTWGCLINLNLTVEDKCVCILAVKKRILLM